MACKPNSPSYPLATSMTNGATGEQLMLYRFVWANIIANRYHTLRWRVRASSSNTLPVPHANPKSLKLSSASTSD